MKSENLGIVHELPAVPESENTALLILEYGEAHVILRSYLDQNDNLVWVDLASSNICNQEAIDKVFPNGFEILSIQFEPNKFLQQNP